MPDLYQQMVSKVYQAKLSNLISELLEEYVIVSMDSSKLGALYDSSTAYLPDPLFLMRDWEVNDKLWCILALAKLYPLVTIQLII